MNPHPIDKPFGEPYTDEELEAFVVFLILDQANLYETVCKAYDILAATGIVTRDAIRRHTEGEVSACIKAAGHRFPNQSARFIKAFGDNSVNLRTVTRDEMVEGVEGIGYKLASRFVRNTRGERVAVIDVHIKAFLKASGINIDKMSYYEIELEFLNIADFLNLSPTDLDLMVWDAYRRGGKK